MVPGNARQRGEGGGRRTNLPEDTKPRSEGELMTGTIHTLSLFSPFSPFILFIYISLPPSIDLSNYLKYFAKSQFVPRKCKALGVREEIVQVALKGFQKAVMKDELEYLPLKDALNHIQAKCEYIWV